MIHLKDREPFPMTTGPPAGAPATAPARGVQGAGPAVVIVVVQHLGHLKLNGPMDTKILVVIVMDD